MNQWKKENRKEETQKFVLTSNRNSEIYVHVCNAYRELWLGYASPYMIQHFISDTHQYIIKEHLLRFFSQLVTARNRLHTI